MFGMLIQVVMRDQGSILVWIGAKCMTGMKILGLNRLEWLPEHLYSLCIRVAISQF